MTASKGPRKYDVCGRPDNHFQPGRAAPQGPSRVITSAFTAEYKLEAARRVIDVGRTFAEAARELGMSEQLMGGWVRDERIRIEAAAVNGSAPWPVLSEHTRMACA